VIRRRDVISGLILAATLTCAHAQQKLNAYRIAFISPSAPVSDMSETGNIRFAAFFKRLRELGYVEGQNLTVERHTGDGRTEHFVDLVSDIVRDNPDLIFVSAGDRLAPLFKTATDTLPIVTVVSDPVRLGLVPSLARPGQNITGVTIDADAMSFMTKRLELLREMVPGVSRVGYLASPAIGDAYTAVLADAAQKMQISVIGPLLAAPLDEREYRRVYAAMAQQGVDALFVGGQSENLTNRRLIVELAAAARLPASYNFHEFADIGGLMTYGPDLPDLFRHAADQVDQIFKGEKPGDIPFYQPTKFELVINLKAAKAIGIEVPGSLLARADEVIE
jgi:putative ABC transport system substrate-binding protein